MIKDDAINNAMGYYKGGMLETLKWDISDIDTNLGSTTKEIRDTGWDYCRRFLGYIYQISR